MALGGLIYPIIITKGVCVVIPARTARNPEGGGRPMYKAMIRRMVRKNVRALQEGDSGPLLASFAEDGVLVFPGQSSWSGEHRGKGAIGAFLGRFVDAGLLARSTTSS
jgi:hypothetical protein